MIVAWSHLRLFSSRSPLSLSSSLISGALHLLPTTRLFSLSRFLALAASLRPFLVEFARVARFSMPSSTLMLLV